MIRGERARGAKTNAPRTSYVATATIVAALVFASFGCGPKEPAKFSPEAMKEAHDPQLLFERGRDYAKSGDLGRSQEYLVASMDAGYDPKKVLPILLRVCVAAGNYHAAALYGDRVLNAHPADTRLRFVVGSLYASTGDIAKARSYLDQVAREDPKDPEAQFALGVLVRDDLKDLPNSDPYFRAYLALAPNGPHAEEARSSLMLEVRKSPTPPADSPSTGQPADSTSTPSVPPTNPTPPSTSATAPRQI